MFVENNDTTHVDVNTEDDLDLFSQDFFQTKSDNDANDSTGDKEDDSPATEEPAEEEVKDETPEDEEESEEDVAEDTEEEKKAFIPKKKKTFQDRIDEVIARQRELERELEAERAKNRETEKVEKTPTPTAKVEDDSPNPDATNEDGTPVYPLGEFDPNYINDLTRHSLEKNRREMEQAAQLEAEAKAVAEAKEALQAEWQSRIGEAEKEYDDFRESVASLEQKFATVDPQYGEYLASTIMAMPKGADVLYYLSQNPEEAAEIVNSGPARATIALGELHGMFKKQEKAKPLNKVSQAPEPPVSLNKGRSATREIPDDTDDLEAFEKKFFKRK